MSMTKDEMIALLQWADCLGGNRATDPMQVAAWMDAAEEARWTAAEAMDAVRKHRAESTEYLLPGHVTQIIRARRRVPARVLAVEKPRRPMTDTDWVRFAEQNPGCWVPNRVRHLIG